MNYGLVKSRANSGKRTKLAKFIRDTREISKHWNPGQKKSLRNKIVRGHAKGFFRRNHKML